MTGTVKPLTRLVLLGFLLIPFMAGCSANQTESNAIMEISDLGFSMKLPPGWKQGRVTLRHGKKYQVQPGGNHCFRSETSGYPFGRVLEFSLDGYGSLEEYVDTPPTMHAKPLSKKPCTIVGLAAIEVVGEGLGENRIPVRGLHVYIRRGEKAILVSFLAPREDYAGYEEQWRESIASIAFEPPATVELLFKNVGKGSITAEQVVVRSRVCSRKREKMYSDIEELYSEKGITRTRRCQPGKPESDQYS